MSSKYLSLCFVAVSAALVLAATSAHAAQPDAQPTSTLYPQHASYVFGSDAAPYAASFHAGHWFVATDDYWIFEPVSGTQEISDAPVVVLFQGFVVDGPWQFERLIRHLTRRGLTVIYPCFLNMWTNPASFADWVDRSTDSIADALAVLDGAGHVPVARDASGRARVAFVAHSIGSYVASAVAERAALTGVVPAPRALVFMDPAGWDYKQMVGIDASAFGDIDASTDVVMLSSEDSLFDADGAPVSNYQNAVHDFVTELPVACDHLSAWVVASDAYAGTLLQSDHYHGPQTHQVLDAIDWWGYWPQLSAQLEYAFWGRYKGFTHAGGRYAGAWRDASGAYLRDVAPRYPHPQYPAGYACP